jgi:hypothetical protein
MSRAASLSFNGKVLVSTKIGVPFTLCVTLDSHKAWQVCIKAFVDGNEAMIF